VRAAAARGRSCVTSSDVHGGHARRQENTALLVQLRRATRGGGAEDGERVARLAEKAALPLEAFRSAKARCHAR
jgi:hypothetical protein